MKKQVTNYYILLLLGVMFAAPGIAAYLFYHHPAWLGSSRINKGTLLNPALAMNSFDGQSKWRIVLFSPDACEQTCLKQLDTLARIRLALGRKLYQVDEWLILGDKASPIAQEINPLLKERDVHVTSLSSTETATLAKLPSDVKVFIANPDSYLILSYQADGNPDDIYKDLKLLLNTSENKSG